MLLFIICFSRYVKSNVLYILYLWYDFQFQSSILYLFRFLLFFIVLSRWIFFRLILNLIILFRLIFLGFIVSFRLILIFDNRNVIFAIDQNRFRPIDWYKTFAFNSNYRGFLFFILRFLSFIFLFLRFLFLLLLLFIINFSWNIFFSFIDVRRRSCFLDFTIFLYLWFGFAFIILCFGIINF